MSGAQRADGVWEPERLREEARLSRARARGAVHPTGNMLFNREAWRLHCAADALDAQAEAARLPSRREREGTRSRSTRVSFPIRKAMRLLYQTLANGRSGNAMRAGEHCLRVALIGRMDRILANIPGPAGDDPPDTPEVCSIRQRLRAIESGRRLLIESERD